MDIDWNKQRGTCTATGSCSLEELADIAASALAAASTQKLATLLLDFSRVQLPRAATMAECYEFGLRLAKAGTGLRKVAFVTPPTCVGEQEFFFTVIANRGLQAAAFLRESEALGWLTD